MVVQSVAIYDELKDFLINPERPDREGAIRSWCPVHEADGKHKNPDLTLHPTKGLTCWVGCTDSPNGFKQVVDALRQRAGQPLNGKPASSTPVSSSAVPRFLAAKNKNVTLRNAYEYREPYTEELLAVKARFEWPETESEKGYTKTFLWKLPEGSYSDGLAGKYQISDMPLYGVLNVVANPTARVWVVEGEECVHRLQSMGEVAVCGAWGAGQREFGKAFDVLKDRDVLLVPDNDVPGRDLMAKYRMELSRAGARSVRTLSLPVPPKGDIVDFLSAGGNLQALTEGLIEQPVIEVVESDRYIIRVPAANGRVFRFDCMGITYSSRELNCEMSVSQVPSAPNSHPFVRRINLLSATACEGLGRSLAEVFATGKEGNWASIINVVVSLVRTTMSQSTRAKRLDTLPDMEAQAWVIDRVVPDRAPIVLFGDGSACKTWIAYSMGLAIALGSGEWCGRKVLQGGVLVIDYETSERQMKERVRRLIRGVGGVDEWMADLPWYWWDAQGQSIPEQTDSIAEFCKKNGITFIIIDAAADACGGEPEKAIVALEYFNALRRIESVSGASSLSIAHITHSAAANIIEVDRQPDTPFGSRFFKQRPRLLWYVAKTDGVSPTNLNIGMFNKKFNDGAPCGPFAYSLTFQDPDGPVTIESQDYLKVSQFAKEAPLGQRISSFMWESNTALTINEIADALHANRDSVRTELNRGYEAQRYMKVGPVAGSREDRWGLMKRGQE